MPVRMCAAVDRGRSVLTVVENPETVEEWPGADRIGGGGRREGRNFEPQRPIWVEAQHTVLEMGHDPNKAATTRDMMFQSRFAKKWTTIRMRQCIFCDTGCDIIFSFSLFNDINYVVFDL